MEKKLGQITFTETDDGFRVEVTGKSLKEMCSCGCIPLFAAGGINATDCCPPADCCPPKEDKK